MTHTWIETVSDRGTVTTRTALDEDLAEADRFQVYRVRVQLSNADDKAASVRAVLEVSADGIAWIPVPEVDPVAGIPFYAASDNGKAFKPRTASIGIAQLRLVANDDPQGVAVAGLSSAGDNPVARLNLPAHGFTEVEFAVRATVDAEWGTTYTFRLRNDDSTLAAPAAPRIAMGAKPPVVLSPGQRSGRSVADPVPLYRLDLTGIDSPASPWAVNATLVGLRMPAAASLASITSPHTEYTLATDACAACHSSHTAQNRMLLQEPAPLSGLCFRCHDGTGASSDVLGDFTDPGLPANDPATSSWYSHPADAAAAHVSDRGDEFGGVLNRHADCVDCHQPHNADASRPIDTTSGWTAAGALKGASGVSVVNGAAGAVPTYTLKSTSTLEYELCFKCHSGYTQLAARDPAHPSRWALDKGVELNPANVSYHPVEAAGRNQTAAMSLNLAGSSPYKLWNFETNETVRCVNCHGDSELADRFSPPAASAILDNHAGPNRGLLIAPYRDRDLLSAAEPYAPANAGLCYVCHSEAPMVDDSGDARADTNFSYHGFHLNDLQYKGSGGRDVDQAGAGQGNATCSECHFRIHGSALAVNGQAPAKGLVNFAPNVLPFDGQLRFEVAPAPGTYGTCTLTCHGKPHANFAYWAAP